MVQDTICPRWRLHRQGGLLLVALSRRRFRQLRCTRSIAAMNLDEAGLFETGILPNASKSEDVFAEQLSGAVSLAFLQSINDLPMCLLHI